MRSRISKRAAGVIRRFFNRYHEGADITITDGDGGSAFTTGSRAACERASDASRILEDVGMELDDAEMVEAILSRYVDEMVAMDAPVSEHLAGLAERILGACHQRGVVFRSDGRPVKVSVPTD